MDIVNVNMVLINVLMGCTALTLIVWAIAGIETIVYDIKDKWKK